MGARSRAGFGRTGLARCLLSWSEAARSLLLRPSFLSPFNIEILLLAIATNTLIALSQMVIIGIGQMNLSVGGIGGLAAISFAGMMQVWGLPPMLAASAALAIGILCGILNGDLVARTGISAFVITLATLSIFKGVNLGITRAQPFYGVPESVKAFGNTTFIHPLPWLILPTVLVVASSGIFSTGSRSGVTCLLSAGTPVRRNCRGFRSSRRSSAPMRCPDFLPRWRA